jgi:hypothetical protein
MKISAETRDLITQSSQICYFRSFFILSLISSSRFPSVVPSELVIEPFNFDNRGLPIENLLLTPPIKFVMSWNLIQTVTTLSPPLPRPHHYDRRHRVVYIQNDSD